MSGTLGEDQAIESLRSGATDYVLKQRLSRLAPAIRRAVAEAKGCEERRRAERQIYEQAALLDKARDAICVTDIDQKILYWNKSAERLYGWSSTLKRSEERRRAAVSGRLTARSWRENPGSGKMDGGRAGTGHQIGQQTSCRKPLTPGQDDEGDPKSMLVINTDITEKRQMEAQFLRSQRMESIGTLAGESRTT